MLKKSQKEQNSKDNNQPIFPRNKSFIIGIDPNFKTRKWLKI
jgi:hypothetical protein